MTLTKHQRDILRLALDTNGGRVLAGRGGWNTAHVRRLEQAGLVRLVSQGAHDSTYRVTEAGRAAVTQHPSGD